MSRWEKKKLAQVSRIIMGQSPSGETYNSDGVGLPFYQGKAEFGIYSPIPVKWCAAPLKIAEKGDILLSVRAPVGPTNIAPHRCCIGRGLSAIRGNENDCRNVFLRYYFKKFESEIANKGVGSTFDAIGKQDIENLEIPLPPLAEQERIVSILDEAEEMKRLRAQANNRTDDLIPALFDEMFGDPVKNKKGWRVGNVGDVVQSIDFGISEALSQGCEYQPGRIAVLRIANITGEGMVDYSDLRYLKVSDKKQSQLLLKKSDLLFNWRNSPKWIGKTAIFNSDEPCIFASFLYRLRIIEEVIDRSFLWFYLNRLRQNGFFESKCRQAVSQANFGRDELNTVQIILPPLSLQKEFAERVEEIHTLSMDQSVAEQKLESLFQSLLHRAFEGEL
jgi:type I restriction enzyme S subunit